jgi:hypothetical protein
MYLALHNIVRTEITETRDSGDQDKPCVNRKITAYSSKGDCYQIVLFAEGDNLDDLTVTRDPDWTDGPFEAI